MIVYSALTLMLPMAFTIITVDDDVTKKRTILKGILSLFYTFQISLVIACTFTVDPVRVPIIWILGSFLLAFIFVGMATMHNRLNCFARWNVLKCKRVDNSQWELMKNMINQSTTSVGYEVEKEVHHREKEKVTIIRPPKYEEDL